LQGLLQAVLERPNRPAQTVHWLAEYHTEELNLPRYVATRAVMQTLFCQQTSTILSDDVINVVTAHRLRSLYFTQLIVVVFTDNSVQSIDSIFKGRA
jgi:hypothetical protein